MLYFLNVFAVVVLSSSLEDSTVRSNELPSESLTSLSTVIVTITNDKHIMGNLEISTEERPYHGFEGIRYARAPSGTGFKPSVPVDSWTGVLDATRKEDLCPEPDNSVGGNGTTEISGNQDCLFLNVYTTKVFKVLGADLPVLVYIHGDSRQSLEPKLFMDMDIVVVTVNYRLAPLGNHSGLVGTLDQILALRWVQENIADYGGDATRVTIMDNGAAGKSVNLLMETPLTKGLFQAAFAQSGSGYSNWSLQKQPEHWTQKMANKLNCSVEGDDDVPETNDVLQPIEQLVRAYKGLQDSDSAMGHLHCQTLGSTK